MGKWNEWTNATLKTFLKGLSGEDPPFDHVGTKYILLLVRDVIVAGIEIVLTGAAIFVYIVIASSLVKVLLAVSIVVSAIRTYATCLRLWNTLFHRASVDL